MIRSFLTNTLLVLMGVVVGLLAAEVFLRVAKPLDPHVLPPGMYITHPEVGYVLTPGFVGEMKHPEFKTRFTTSQAGLRGPELRPRQPKTVRILVLGDSQAWGYGVRDEETFSARLEVLLSEQFPELDVQILNAGVPGYGTADELVFLQSRGPALAPDLVLLQFLSVNDFEENRSPARMWAHVQDGWLVEPVQSLPFLLRAITWLNAKSRLAHLVNDRLGYLLTRAGILGGIEQLWGEDFTEEDARITTELLVQVAKSAEALGAPCLFLYTTGWNQVIANTTVSPRSATVVEVAAEQANVPWINLSALFRQRTDRFALYYVSNGHWTATGHKAVAEILANRITELGLITPRTK